MFRAVCNAKDFKKIVDAMSNLVDEICFEVDENGIKASAMDPSHVALVSVNLPKEAFDEYVADIHDIGIDLEALKKFMSRGKSNEKMILELDEEKNKLNITFKNEATRKFSIALYDVSSTNLKVPEIEYPNEILIKAGGFVEALKDAELVNDHVTLKVDNDVFTVYSKGDLNQSETVFENGSETILDLKIDSPSRSTFNLAYLKDITKSTSADDVLKIYLGSDMPVKIEYEIANANLLFLLAPRIES
ncbi:MAG: proliferating cell nuclear antigen [Methanothermococcus sp.]|jgi:proliferating cell nuclear antigen|uniref:DNA polymerase sliding clamp n=1 Tax=Methanothermococcus TaxID=155862 RepID=UPI00036CBF62|nr:MULTISPECIES: DNA polymerase sliding clamp [Methanothermococcus]MDK2790303.1 proliferating cell nuclear antigen [Methanothermococcus sp.]MDK2987809.1 proliferating cell nuclear antigen [Methanothermococcus sp.]